MGEVFKAEDTTLGRPVALKFLAAHLLNDDEAKARFFREARAAAAVSHPNICHVYEIAEENGKTFLAMDYLEGDSLEKHIAQGPLPLKDALDIGRQIAEGLEAAQEKEIVHRDITPANVIVDVKGRATILDFGLARLAEASKLTRADQTVGTAAYMSPEQIQGSDVDQRTDIWALGCVLYEMVAGVRPFQGQYDQALAYEIVQEEPEPLTGVRAGLPMELEILVSKCLAKESDDRYGSASEVTRDLRTLGDKLRSGQSTVLRTASIEYARTEVPQERQPNKGRVWALVAGAAFVGASLSWFVRPTPEIPAPQSVVFTVEPPEDVAFDPGDYSAPLISPDGTKLAFVDSSESGRNLWVRHLDSLAAERLEGTANAQFPFWSPDSRHLGFFADGRLKRVDTTGGPTQTLCDVRDGRGGTWNIDEAGNGVIYFSPDGGGVATLYAVPADGGEPFHAIEDPPSESGASFSYRHPHFLSGQGRVLFYRQAHAYESVGEIRLAETESFSQATVLRASSSAWFAPPLDSTSDGHLLYILDDTLFAHLFDAQSGNVLGERIPIAEGVTAADKFGGDFSVSENGTLVYRSGAAQNKWEISWFDRQGKVIESIETVDLVSCLRLSPDESRLAMVLSREDGNDIWVRDLGRNVSTRLTFEGVANRSVVWSPDGGRVAYPLREDSVILAKRADGSGESVEISGGVPDREAHLYDWSPDGRYLAMFTVPQPWDLYALPLVGGGEPVPLETQDYGEIGGSLSPDGKWIAYYSFPSGRREVFVRRFPEGEGRWQISVDGGRTPIWSDDGSQIYYFSGKTVMTVPVSTTPTFEAGKPEALFEIRGRLSAFMPYDVTADNERFVIAVAGGASDLPITVVTNWQQALLR